MRKAMAAMQDLRQVTEAPDATMAAPSLTREAAEEAERVADLMPGHVFFWVCVNSNAGQACQDEGPSGSGAQSSEDAVSAVTRLVMDAVGVDCCVCLCS